jgi:hypothetical protein
VDSRKLKCLVFGEDARDLDPQGLAALPGSPDQAIVRFLRAGLFQQHIPNVGWSLAVHSFKGIDQGAELHSFENLLRAQVKLSS